MDLSHLDEENTMSKLLSRLVFGLCLVAAPMMIGCGGDTSAPAPAPAANPAPAPAPAGGGDAGAAGGAAPAPAK